jgi:hypothetical protein
MDRGQNHKSPSMWFLQWRAPREACADPDCTHPKDALARDLDCALDREHLLLRANPTVDRDDDGHALDTGRITLQTLRDLRQELAPEEYMRECLGWPEDLGAGGGPPALNAGRWAELRKPDTPAPKRACVVLHTEPDRSVTSIGVAGENADGDRVILEHTAPGEAWVIERLKSVQASVDVLEVALHPSGQAKTLIPALKAAGINLTSKTDDDELGYRLVVNDLSAGCASLITKTETGGVRHLGQPELDAAAAVARTRLTPSGQQLWDSATSPVPLAPLVSVSTALYRYELLAADKKVPPPPPRSLGRGATTRRRSGRDLNSIGF